MDLNKHTVVKLRDLLKERGLDTKGVKSILVERLAKALENETKNEDQNENESSPTPPVEEEPPRKLPPRTPGRSTRNAAAMAAAVASPRTPSRSSRSASRHVSPPKVLDKLEEIPEEEPQTKKPRIEESAPEKKKPEPAQKESVEVSASPKKVDNESAAPVVVEKPVEKSAPKIISSPVKIPDADMSLKSATPKVVEQVPEARKAVQLSPQKPVQQPSLQKPVQLSPQKPNEQPSPQKPVQRASPQKPAEQPSPQKPVQLSPQKPELSPQKVEQSPQKVEQSPQKVEQSPQKVEQSPQKVEQSPQKVEQSPHKVEMSPQKPVQQSPQKPAEQSSPQKPQVSPKKSPEKAEKQVIEAEIDDISKNSGQGQVQSNAQEKSKDVDMKEENEKQQGEYDNEMMELDRKPSFQEETQAVPKLPDDEPEFDEKSVILSWYDSDLNLKIEKDTFATAMPMQEEGFRLFWAGARASYGVVKGKVFYEAKILEQCQADHETNYNVYALRLGWSVTGTTMQLGEEALSFGFESTGKKCLDRNFEDYGQEFGPGDVVGSYLDLSSENQGTISFSVNGKDLGVAFTFDKQNLDGKALFPHVLSKNYRFACNFGEDKSWAEQSLQGYGLIGSLDIESRVQGPMRPEKKEDCEVIMMCGMPGSGKTYWSEKHALGKPEKMFCILGMDQLLEKTKVLGEPTKEDNKNIIERMCNKVMNKLIDMAYTKRRNYILDQTNTYTSAQKRKMKNFVGFQKKAVVVFPTDEEYKTRLQKSRKVDGKELNDAQILDVKASFKPPSVGELFDSVEWVGLDEKEAKKQLEQYNKEGKAAENARFLKNQIQRENRDNRNNWDGNRWASGYDRNRGGGGGGQRRGGGNNGGSNWSNNRGGRGGGPMRHGNFGGGQGSWRGRGGTPPHRGGDRFPMSAAGDRRPGNDRNRSMHSGQFRGQYGGYQGQQGGSWGQQGGSWSGNQGQGGGWNQQSGGWNQPNWKGGYGQQGGSNYAPPANYSTQPHYDNGNYNNWSQQQQQHQYYSQAYNWGQSSGSTNTPETENKQ